MSIDPKIQSRRENVFLALSGFFICAMCLLNVVGIIRFVQLGPFSVSVGVLVYPITFFCTDIVSEIYGKKKANFLVTLGFFFNIFIMAYLYIVKMLPTSLEKPSWQAIHLSNPVSLPNGALAEGEVEVFQFIFASMSGAVAASMIAYLLAQYIDVYVFHWVKEKTKGKHLWLRNNISTVSSQFIDSISYMSIVFAASLYSGEMTMKSFAILLFSNYSFKCLSALFDTPFIYAAVHHLRKYLDVEGTKSIE